MKEMILDTSFYAVVKRKNVLLAQKKTTLTATSRGPVDFLIVSSVQIWVENLFVRLFLPFIASVLPIISNAQWMEIASF